MLTESSAQMIITFHREHVMDAFGRGRDGYRKWRDGGTGNKGWGERLTVAFVVKLPLALIITFLQAFLPSLLPQLPTVFPDLPPTSPSSAGAQLFEATPAAATERVYNT